MFKWLRDNIYEINFFVAGFCASSALNCLATESYGLAALNAALVIVNIKLARS